MSTHTTSVTALPATSARRTASAGVVTSRANSASPSAPACATERHIFQHPLVEDGASAASSRERAQRTNLLAQAARICADCPLVTECLHRAVVQHDVAGFVGGTTEAQRRAIRRLLDVRVDPEDLAEFTGQREASQRVSTDLVAQARAQHPEESLPELAVRLGCSLSTVKRHLRARRDGETAVDTPCSAPTVQEVVDAYEMVCGRRTASSAA